MYILCLFLNILLLSAQNQEDINQQTNDPIFVFECSYSRDGKSQKIEVPFGINNDSTFYGGMASFPVQIKRHHVTTLDFIFKIYKLDEYLMHINIAAYDYSINEISLLDINFKFGPKKNHLFTFFTEFFTCKFEIDLETEYKLLNLNKTKYKFFSTK